MVEESPFTAECVRAQCAGFSIELIGLIVSGPEVGGADCRVDVVHEVFKGHIPKVVQNSDCGKKAVAHIVRVVDGAVLKGACGILV